MAALLRSARLLKFSTSGLLQVTGTKRTGPPLCRLYSNAVGGNRSRVCPRQINLASGNATSRAWPHAAGCVRTYTAATEQKSKTNVAVQTKQAQDFDWALTKLDSSVRRTGRITKTLLLRVFHDICRTGYPSGNQALLLLRSCGSLLPEVPLEERTELAHRVWKKLEELGAQYDVSHYNALLKVYLQNDFKFSPTDFLAKMEAANVQPNRVTYQRLIAAYCQNGDIEGASTILGFMKSKDLPITEDVFIALLTGHARAGDIESAKSILTVMKGAGIEPGPDTYVSLMNAYAEKGDMDSLKETLERAESADCSLTDRDLMQVIFTLAKAGHEQHVPEMVERLRHERGFIPDAMNLILNLITQGLEDTAFNILNTFPALQSDYLLNESPNIGNFFLRHCVNKDVSLEKLRLYCKELQKSDRHAMPISFTLSCALEAKKSELSFELMKLLKEQDLPIRPHYFWPLLTQPLKDGNTAGVVEVLKGMQELGVSPDLDTLSNYIIPFFGNDEAARQALKDSGVSVDSEGFFPLEVRAAAVGDLAQFYNMLSDPSFPTLYLNVFRSSLTQGFKKSNDVESMVKITELLFKDQRFTQETLDPHRNASFFLYHVIESSSKAEVQAQEDKLKEYFQQLKAQNITISANIYRGIRNRLVSYQVPELIKCVNALVDPNDQEPYGSLSAPSQVTGNEGKVLALENRLADLKQENKPFGLILKQLIQALATEENLQRALELKQQHEEEMTISSYTVLITLCCRLDKAEEAKNLRRELSRKDSSFALNANKYLTLIKTFSLNGLVDEAVDILKEMKEKEVMMDDTDVTKLFHMFNALAAKGDATTIQRLQDTVFVLGLTKPTSNLCSTLITAHLNNKDVSAALEAYMDCQNRYSVHPRFHDIIIGLMEKGETELLQKAMDFVTKIRGEMHMLYDLFFAFLQTGRYREALQVIQTPGLRARPGRLNWFAEKCISGKRMETLEQMVNMTAKLFECDRDEMYYYILRLCKSTNDWQKAESVWTKLQEENVVPRERTLLLLADILKSNGQEVPFEVPETWHGEAVVEDIKPAVSTDRRVTDYRARLSALCKRGKAQEAYEMLKDAEEKSVEISSSTYDQVLCALLASGSLEDAMAVKDIATSHIPQFQLRDTACSLLIITLSKKGRTKDALDKLKSMLSENQVPSKLAATRLVQAFGRSGDVEGIQEMKSLVKDFNLPDMIYVNNTALAHIKNGDLESAVELLEEVLTRPDSKNPSMSFVFRRVLEEDNHKALDKLSAMTDRLANHFGCYKPASELFLQLVDMDKVEDAKFMLARCNAVAEQKDVLLSYVTQKAQTPGQLDKIKILLSLIPNFTTKEVLFTYLIKCHYLDEDLAPAKALYEEMQREGIPVDELSLKRLAMLYRRKGETAPFPEPPESFNFYAKKLREKNEETQSKGEE